MPFFEHIDFKKSSVSEGRIECDLRAFSALESFKNLFNIKFLNWMTLDYFSLARVVILKDKNDSLEDYLKMTVDIQH